MNVASGRNPASRTGSNLCDMQGSCSSSVFEEWNWKVHTFCLSKGGAGDSIGCGVVPSRCPDQTYGRKGWTFGVAEALVFVQNVLSSKSSPKCCFIKLKFAFFSVF